MTCAEGALLVGDVTVRCPTPAITTIGAATETKKSTEGVSQYLQHVLSL